MSRDWPKHPSSLVALARATDPATSHGAAEAATGELADLHGRIVRAIATNAEACRDPRAGLTTTEIAEALSKPRDSISPRMAALVKARIIEDSGERRIPRGHTRPSIVWRAARTPAEAQSDHDKREAVLAALREW